MCVKEATAASRLRQLREQHGGARAGQRRDYRAGCGGSTATREQATGRRLPESQPQPSSPRTSPRAPRLISPWLLGACRPPQPHFTFLLLRPSPSRTSATANSAKPSREWRAPSPARCATAAPRPWRRRLHGRLRVWPGHRRVPRRALSLVHPACLFSAPPRRYGISVPRPWLPGFRCVWPAGHGPPHAEPQPAPSPREPSTACRPASSYCCRRRGHTGPRHKRPRDLPAASTSTSSRAPAAGASSLAWRARKAGAHRQPACLSKA